MLKYLLSTGPEGGRERVCVCVCGEDTDSTEAACSCVCVCTLLGRADDACVARATHVKRDVKAFGEG